MAPEPRPLRPGDRAPDFVLPDAQGTLTRFYGIAGGRPLVLVFSTGLDEAQALANDTGLEVIAIVSSPPTEPGLKTLVDADGVVRASYRTAFSTAVVLDPNLRVVAALPIGDYAAIALAAKPSSTPAIEVAAQAPVLLIPGALDLGLCAETIAFFEAHGSVETGVERSTNGERRASIEPTYKQRRDHTVEDPAFLKHLTESVGRRVVPEVERAFSFRATRFEGFKIAAYDVGGFFRLHRDNLSPSTAHRRFALTLNLNDGYDGGQLRFPEHAPHLYKPAAGGALIFSCSLLHEALPVTSGRRLVLLSFLFGAEDQRRGPRPER